MNDYTGTSSSRARETGGVEVGATVSLCSSRLQPTNSKIIIIIIIIKYYFSIKKEERAPCPPMNLESAAFTLFT